MSCRGIALASIGAGTTTKVRLSGHAQWKEPTDDLTIPYTLSIYVQNADVDPRCEPSKSAQLQPGVSHVLLCGYQRYITDDVAEYQLPVTVAQPTCSLSRSAVRRGRALSIACNFTGSLNVRFRRGSRARAKVVKLGATGKGRLSTASLSPGRYSVSMTSGRLAVRVAKRRIIRVS